MSQASEWLAAQRVTLSLAVEACRVMVAAAVSLAEELPAEKREALAEAIDELNRYTSELRAADEDYPSERRTPAERRGRPRARRP